MSSYIRITFCIFLLVNLSLFGEEKNNLESDLLTAIALDREFNNDFSNSSSIYLELFKKTNNSEYLKKVIDSYMKNQEFAKVKKLSIENLKSHQDIEEYLLIKVIASSILIKQFDDAIPFAKQLEDKYDTVFNIALIGDLSYSLGKFEDASKNYEKAYNVSQNTNILLALANVLYTKLDNKSKAIQYLQEFTDKNGYIEDVCMKLLEYYQNDNNIFAMIKIAEKMYENTKDKSIFGRIAMIKFEMAEDKKLILNDVFSNFELALSQKSNPEYENFYGYLLIDYDVDVKKGLELVKKAHLGQPDDIAILDSLAWGYFKNNECDLAYKYINQVAKKAGLDNEEISLHHKKITECFNKKSNKKEDMK